MLGLAGGSGSTDDRPRRRSGEPRARMRDVAWGELVGALRRRCGGRLDHSRMFIWITAARFFAETQVISASPSRASSGGN
jgi:hypothetical protein